MGTGGLPVSERLSHCHVVVVVVVALPLLLSRHVFNNVDYNVDFSSILFHRTFFRIPLPTFISF